MFSVIFPGQGSQIVGMGKEFYDKYDLVKALFKEADDTLNMALSKIILEGPKEELDQTENTPKVICIVATINKNATEIFIISQILENLSTE